MRIFLALLLTLSLHYLAVLPADRYLYYAAAASWSALYCIIVLKGIKIRESVPLAYIELGAIACTLSTAVEIALAPNSVWLRNHYADIMQLLFYCEIIVIAIGGARYGFTRLSSIWVDLHNLLSSLHRYLCHYRVSQCKTQQIT